MSRLDPVTLEIVEGTLASIEREVETAIGRTARSPMIRDAHDFRAGIHDRQLRKLTGRSYSALVHPVVRDYPIETMNVGDVYFHNDVYLSEGGIGHLPDLCVTVPVFYEGEVVAFVQAFGHHDDIGGALTAVRFDVAWIGRHSTDPALQQHAASAAEMLQHAIGASQRIMMNLRPPVLEQGLVAAVQWLAAGFERRTGVPARVVSSSDTLHTPADVQLVAYRTAQEALTNISKYAQARQVDIDLSDREGVLTLEVSDDGRGIAPRMLEKPKAFGLRGLQERARTVGGWLDISSRPGQGTSVILSIPLTSGALPPDSGDAQ